MKRIHRLLREWSVNEDEPQLAELICAFAVFVILLIVVYVYTLVLAPVSL